MRRSLKEVHHTKTELTQQTLRTFGIHCSMAYFFFLSCEIGNFFYFPECIYKEMIVN